MNVPKVSVIIPTYNGGKLLPEAIQSVLDQTYLDFELIIVNDASPDKTSEIIAKFNDPRIKYIVHEKNQGVDRSRVTGFRASRGEIIAFLDQDDFFHPDKLQSHVEFYEQHPDVDFTYNARFEMNYSANTIRSLWRPSRNITLAELVLWFPIAPSDWVLRRDCAFILADLMDASQRWTGGEIVYLGHLFMSGCTFAFVDRALNYRRHHSGRIFKDLSGGCSLEIAAQDKIFDDLRCPQDVLALHDRAHANIYMFWAFRAFIQDETYLGQEFVRNAIKHKPTILIGKPCELARSLVINCSDDENLDHTALMKRVFAQLPKEAAVVSEQYEWAVTQGYLFKGTRAAIWDRTEDALSYFNQAKQMEAEIDESFLSHLTRNLLDFEAEFGDLSSRKLLKTLLSYLKNLESSSSMRQLRGMFALNSAFQNCHLGNYKKVLGRVMQAIVNNPRYITNYGLMTILFRSIGNSLTKI